MAVDLADILDTVICGDCLEVMKELPDKCVDLVLTDPPYPKEFDYVWDILALSYRVAKEGAFLGTMCGHYQVPRVIDAMRSTGWEWFWPCITRNNNQPIMHGFKAKCCHKPFLFFRKNKGLPNRIFFDNFSLRAETRRWKDAQDFHKWGQDTSTLYEPIDSLSPPNGVVFDPFSGSGTTLLVSKLLGRHFIGIEISEEYCKIARERIEAEKKGLTVKELRKGQGTLLDLSND